MTVKVINIGNIVANDYILITEKGCAVIDTGYSGGFERFSKKLSQQGLSMDDITLIFITHAHDDHVGFLGELIANTKAPVILHPEAVGRLKEGHNRFTGGCPSKIAQLFCKLMALAGRGKHEFPAVDVSDRAVITGEGNQLLKEAGIPGEILFLPGHTVDSIGLLFEDGRLFCGDAAMNNFPSIDRHPIWMESVEDFRRSWDIIIGSGASTIYPSHGRPFPIQDLQRYRNYMNGKKLLPI